MTVKEASLKKPDICLKRWSGSPDKEVRQRPGNPERPGLCPAKQAGRMVRSQTDKFHVNQLHSGAIVIL